MFVSAGYLVLNDCVVHYNRAVSGAGGGISVLAGVLEVESGLVLSHNSAPLGGGLGGTDAVLKLSHGVCSRRACLRCELCHHDIVACGPQSLRRGTLPAATMVGRSTSRQPSSPWRTPCSGLTLPPVTLVVPSRQLWARLTCTWASAVPRELTP